MSQKRIYQSELPYFITTNVKDGGWIFQDRIHAEVLHGMILRACSIHGFLPIAFSILPNHFHLLVEPPYPHSGCFETSVVGGGTISNVMHTITRNISRHVFRRPVWQKSFYVRLVTDDVYLANVVPYILHNYQKLELPGRFGTYPYVYQSEKS